ncbi:MAG: hypothetical protein K9N38_10175 [Candidatus Marinimicrobia bacterium]|nr:hypothetical protein [Candidatus Neomarinimicrobiota bacterium]
MRATTLLAFATVALLLVSCEGNGITDSIESGGDGNLITAIQKSTSRELIDLDQLPAVAQHHLNNEYTNHQPVQALVANSYGYEVFMEGQWTQYGVNEVVYFDMDGRNLTWDQGTLQERGKRFGRFNRCFEFAFPITLIMPDSSTITLDSAADRSLVRDWFVAHPEIEGRPELQFPVTIIYEDGTEAVIADREEMQAAKSACPRDPARRGDECFSLEFPVSYIMPDGSIIIVNTEGEFVQLRDWRNANPDLDARPLLDFPVTIIYQDGTQVEITSAEDMQLVRRECAEERRQTNGRRQGGGNR